MVLSLYLVQQLTERVSVLALSSRFDGPHGTGGNGL